MSELSEIQAWSNHVAKAAAEIMFNMSDWDMASHVASWLEIPTDSALELVREETIMAARIAHYNTCDSCGKF